MRITYQVVRIHADGSYDVAPFRVRVRTRSRRFARIRAVTFRKGGWLARVRKSEGGLWVVAVRRPRVLEPASWQLEV